MIHEGVMALAVAILSPQYLTPDQCFERLFSSNSVMKRQRVSDDVVDEMAMLKKTMTYKQIGDMFGMKPDAVYARIRRAQGRI